MLSSPRRAAVVTVLTGVSALAALPAQATSGPVGAPTTPPTATWTGWVASDLVSARVHAQASTESAVVGTYAPHAKVTGTLTGSWVKTAKGFVNRGMLEQVTSDPRTLNGRLAVTSLCKVPLAWNAGHRFSPGYTPTTQRYLNCDALTHLTRLQNAFYARFGQWAAIDLTYRDLAEQQYWYDKLGYPTAAMPGTSNHGYGLAVDFEEDLTPGFYSWGHPGNDWLLANAPAYGFRNPFAVSKPAHEDYHFDFVG